MTTTADDSRPGSRTGRGFRRDLSGQHNPMTGETRAVLDDLASDDSVSSTLKRALAKLTRRMEGLEDENDKLQNDLKSASKESLSRQIQLNKKGRELLEIREKLVEVQSASSERDQGSRGLERQITQLEREKAALLVDLDDTGGAFKEVEARFDVLDTELESTLRSLQIEFEKHNQTKSALTEAEEEAARANRTVKSHEARIAELEGRLQAAHERANELRIGRGGLETELEKTRGERDEALDLAEQARNELEARPITPVDVTDRLADSVRAMEETISDREGLAEDAKNTRDALNKAGEQSSTLNSDLKELGEELKTTRSSFASALKHLEDVETTAQTDEPPLKVDDFIGTVQEHVRTLFDSLEQLRAEVHASESDGTKERVGVTEAIRRARLELKSRDADIVKLRKRILAQRRRVQSLANQIEAATIADEGLQGEVARRDAAIWQEVRSIKSLRGELLGEPPVIEPPPPPPTGAHQAVVSEIDRTERTNTDNWPAVVGEPPPDSVLIVPAEEVDVRDIVEVSDLWTEDDDAELDQALNFTVEDVGSEAATMSLPSGTLPAEAVDGDVDEAQLYREAAWDKLHDESLSHSDRIGMMLEAKPTLESAKLSNDKMLSSEAAALTSRADGSVTIRKLVELSGMDKSEAATILVDLLLARHLKIIDIPLP